MRWQANVELNGQALERVTLSRRLNEGRLSVVPGLVYRFAGARDEAWWGFGAPIGLTRDTDHIRVA